MTINEKLNNIQEGVLLANHTTFRIGGPAKYFFEAETREDLSKALKWARKNNIPYFILGGGSNLLVSDKGFEGLVIKIQNTKYKIPRSRTSPAPEQSTVLDQSRTETKFLVRGSLRGRQNTKIFAEAGALLTKLVIESANNNLTGLEWAAGIPGTIAGAVCGNAGAYGHSISENVTGGKMINQKGDLIDFNKEDCGFYYRGSAFKDGNGLVIVEVELKLENDKDGQAKETIKKILADRRNKIPTFPSAGSFFKNYVLEGDEDKSSSIKFLRSKNEDGDENSFSSTSPFAVAREKENLEKDPLLKRFPELKTQIKGGKLAVGHLIEQCGLKGKTVGGAQISGQHGNFIVNIGGAKSSDVLELAKICKDRVKEKFGVEPEEETRFLGF